MSENIPSLLMSLKPLYAELVLGGMKTAELRRRISTGVKGRDVFVYVSSPVMEVRGGFRVGEVWSGSPEEIWREVANLAGVSEEVFFNYYSGKEMAFALEIVDVWEYEAPISLGNLRNKFSGFVAPQSYRYLAEGEAKLLRSLKRAVARPEVLV